MARLHGNFNERSSNKTALLRGDLYKCIMDHLAPRKSEVQVNDPSVMDSYLRENSI